MQLDDAKTLRPGTIVHYTGENQRGKRQPCTRTIGPRGGVTESVVQCRVNGKVKRWKREPDRIEIPVKRGLYEFAYITNENVADFHRADDCPLDHES